MSEKSLHKAVCTYLKYQYPHILFNTELSGVRVSRGIARQLPSLRSQNGFPDIAIYEPHNGYHGLFVELKREGENLYKKNGEPTSPHVAEQMDCMVELRMRGYKAEFAVGWEAAKELIDTYLKGTL